MTLQLFSLYVWGWQLAAQAKDRGIPQDVIDLAFKKESTLTEERERSLFGSVENFGKEMSSELSWMKLQEDARIACVDRVVIALPTAVTRVLTTIYCAALLSTTNVRLMFRGFGGIFSRGVFLQNRLIADKKDDLTRAVILQS
jgi:hypothetical protein